jgi:hypothetical protein
MPLLEDLEEMGEKKSKSKKNKPVITPIVADVGEESENDTVREVRQVLSGRLLKQPRCFTTDDTFIA